MEGNFGPMPPISRRWAAFGLAKLVMGPSVLELELDGPTLGKQIKGAMTCIVWVKGSQKQVKIKQTMSEWVCSL